MRIVLIAVFALLGATLTHAQSVSKYTISGYVRDTATGEEMIGVTIRVKEMPSEGAVTNVYGFYSLTVPSGTYTIEYQYTGYTTRTEKVNLLQDTRMDIKLKEVSHELKEVIVSSERKDANITGIQMGVEKISMKEIETIPVLMGEKDVLKTLQLRPGVKAAGEGNSGFYVRGGAADQNLILLDEATVYNASHLLGFFSVFNSDALKDVTLYKGSQPAQYGGRLASVLDIRMQDGNDKQYGAEGGLGLISSRLKIDGPIVKDKGSFTISGRRTYADLFLKLSPDSNLNRARLYFYDLNAKANYRLDDKNRLFLSGYFGKDVLGFGDKFGINWGNYTGTLRWNHLFSARVFSNTSLIMSNYNYNININLGGTSGDITSRIRDYNLKEDMQYYANSANTIKFGFNSVYHNIIPGVISILSNNQQSTLDLAKKYAWENALYLSHEYKPGKSFSVEYGARLTSFTPIGPGTFYTYDTKGIRSDSSKYASGAFVKTYVNAEPRLAVNYLINEKSSVKASYDRNTQNLHLLSNSTSGNPTDLWIPSSNNVKPEIADQVSLGYFRNFKDNSFEFSCEVYYKAMQNQVDYKDGAQLNFNENVEADLLFGTGRAYGMELFFRKKYGRLTGWVGYTLSKSEKKIAGINNGDYYNAKQDRTHDISVVGIYELAKKWTVSSSWVYYTGNAVTFPSGKYTSAGQVVNYYSERNGYRMPAYHRLDIGVTWYRKKTAKRESSWNFSLYNAYGRENAYTITFQQDPNDPTRTQAVQTTLFRWIPSITYNFKF
jgi:CarboxypepD_reg-like domain/TonB-dependent Receptor Plug Domain